MCGICGYIKFDGAASAQDDTVIRRMNKKLFHRGPDAQDALLIDNVVLGFSRLSIIGLSDGMQPIFNEDGSLVLICNGEIFNYVELREDLMKRGHRFKTRSDVEVIVHLYEEEGMAFIHRLNGQFAFALYDKKERVMICARDPMGICPLYYTHAGNHLVFASEIKSILEHPSAPREVDLVGLDQVFTFAGLVSPRTMFKNINSLENGHYLRIDHQGVVRDIEYWDLVYPESGSETDGRPEHYYLDRLEELFERSIRFRLRADVPTGLYLSGGLDSSMIAMKMHQLFPHVKKDAFSIDFVESEISETPYQLLIANESNSRLYKKTFLFSDISERLRQAIYHCECPLKETYNTASLSLSEATRERGIKVILSGEGSDELFAGYVGYRLDQMRALRYIRDSGSPMEEDLRERIWGDRSFVYEKNYLELEITKRGLYSDAVNETFDSVNCLNHFVVNKERLRGRSVVNKRSYLDYKLRLVDHLVTDHGDKMALANSVEVRYPFLDKDLVDFSRQIPPELKLKDLTEKYIVKGVAGRFVPEEVVNREKFGFVAPGSPYLLQHNSEYINDLLSYDRIKRQGYFNPDRVETLKQAYCQQGFQLDIPFESDWLITVITFGILLDEYFS